MILGALHTLVSAVLVVLILIGMLAMLVGMQRVVSPWQDSSDVHARRLRHDVEGREEVITTDSVFRQFLARDASRRPIRHRFGSATPAIRPASRAASPEPRRARQ